MLQHLVLRTLNTVQFIAFQISHRTSLQMIYGWPPLPNKLIHR